MAGFSENFRYFFARYHVDLLVLGDLLLAVGLIGALANGGRTRGGRIGRLGTLLAVIAVLLVPAGFSAIDLLVLGELLVAAGLIGALAVVNGGRTRRLGALLAVIALLALLLGVAIALRRQASRSLFSQPVHYSMTPGSSSATPQEPDKGPFRDSPG